MGIDLGVRNLATVITNNGKAVIYDGRRLISKFRWFAKTKGKLQSKLTKQELKHNKRLSQLTVMERNYANDYLHKISKMIVDFAVNNIYKVSRIVIGELNKGISSINIGRKNNEKLHRLPLVGW
ncbi:transposase [Methanococcus aeolicus]|uniref:transposase n=1 Tax=Methanococcus aeolicus TaxID=42879 RepID=UPI0021CA7CAF|nr:transposase [Methanococcus aeolicus]UXM84466.1 transposase [Methanococcus aeolicus]